MVRRTFSSFAALVLAFYYCTAPAEAQSLNSVDPACLPEVSNGTLPLLIVEGNAVWHAQDPPTLQELAKCAAPIVWMSPDEREAPLGPQEYEPCLGVPQYSDKALVYVQKLREQGTRGRPDWRVSLRYHFYYPSDPSHCGDLEGVTLSFRGRNAFDSQYEVVLINAAGSAHGNRYLGNRLRVSYDVRLPLTILVEENKHASVPDRNGDRYYTPGHDVNVNVRDAWGLRDNFADGVLATGFDSSMAKQTRAQSAWRTRIFPPTVKGGTIPRWQQHGEFLQIDLPNATQRDNWNSMRSYELYWVDDAVRDGARSPRRYREGSIILEAANMLAPSLRLEPGHGPKLVTALALGGPSMPAQLPFLGWTDRLPVNIGLRWMIAPDAGSGGVDVSMSPSLAGRLADWYASASISRFDLDREIEVGVRARWKPPFMRDSLPLIGMRLGVRAAMPRLRNQRLVLEFGNGYF